LVYSTTDFDRWQCRSARKLHPPLFGQFPTNPFTTVPFGDNSRPI
jgi:hypothetical protein